MKSDLLLKNKKSKFKLLINEHLFLKKLNPLILVVAVLVLVYSCNTTAWAQWSVNYDELSGKVEFVEYGNGIFVAAGESGIIKTSSDGKNWTTRRHQGVNTHESFTDLIFDGKRFIIFEFNSIIVSKDGISWSKIADNNKTHLYKVVFNGKTYVAISQNTTFYYSSDLKTWKAAKNTKLEPGYWTDLKWGKDRFIATSDRSIKVSKDGINWSNCKAVQGADKIDWDGKYFYIYKTEIQTVKKSENYDQITITYKYKSKDGFTWTKLGKVESVNKLFTDQDNDPLSSSIQDIACNGKIYVGVGGDYKGIFTSDDGMNWRAETWGNIYNFTSAATNGKNIVLVSEVRRSNNSKTFNEVKLVVLKDGKYNEIASKTPDGQGFNKAYYKNGKYIVLFSDMILVSEDGISWGKVGNVYGTDVIWDGESYIILGGMGKIFKSKDALNWEQVDFSIFINDYKGDPIDLTFVHEIAFFKGSYYLIGTNAGQQNIVILESRDLIHWHQTAQELYDYTCVFTIGDAEVINGELLFTSANFYTTGSIGYIFSTKDGEKWNEKVSTSMEFQKGQVDFNYIAYSGNQYICTTLSGVGYLTSKDGIKWSFSNNIPVDARQSINDVIYDGTQFIFVGDNGLIVKGMP